MKILLMCGAGASSGFMAQAMRKAAKEQGLDDIDVIARSEAEMTNNLKGTDIIMFGPHLAYKKDALAKELEQYNIPFAFIDKDAYGAIDGAATLKQAMDVLKGAKPQEVEKEPVKEVEKKEVKADKNVENQKGFMGLITNSLAPKLDKLTQNVYIMAIQQSIMSILPMIMIGSVSSIVGVFRNFEALSWIPDISQLNTFSFGLIAIFLTILVPMKVLEKKGNEKLKISAMLSSLALFFIITIPNIADGNISFVMDKIGTGGMLTAVVTAVFTAWIFNVASNHSMFKKDTVMPDMVVAWMDALVPVTITLVIGLVIMNTGFDLPLFIRGLFSPISAFGQTWLGLIAITFFTCFLYSFGFTWILFPIAWAIWMEGMDANMAAVAAGHVAQNINLMETVMGLTYIGGQGCTLALVIMCMRSKVKRLKAIGNVCVLPAIFNINEPILFGLPIVLNPILAIPFILAPLISGILTYLVIYLGIIPPFNGAYVPWTTPAVLSGYLVGGWQGMVWQVIILALTSLLYWPFAKAYDNILLKEEAETEAEINAAE